MRSLVPCILLALIVFPACEGSWVNEMGRGDNCVANGDSWEEGDGCNRAGTCHSKYASGSSGGPYPPYYGPTIGDPNNATHEELRDLDGGVAVFDTDADHENVDAADAADD